MWSSRLGHRPAPAFRACDWRNHSGRIGFDGLLIRNDLGSSLVGRSATGPAGDQAGCDVALHCSGDMAEMLAIAAAVGELSEAATLRLERAMATVAMPEDASYEDLAAKRDALLSYA